MPEPLEVYSLRLPPPMMDRLRDRARVEDVRLADLLRRYVEAGDRADTRREQKLNTPA